LFFPYITLPDGGWEVRYIPHVPATHTIFVYVDGVCISDGVGVCIGGGVSVGVGGVVAASGGSGGGGGAKVQSNSIVTTAVMMSPSSMTFDMVRKGGVASCEQTSIGYGTYCIDDDFFFFLCHNPLQTSHVFLKLLTFLNA
jgi:hypothetical protein